MIAGIRVLSLACIAGLLSGCMGGGPGVPTRYYVLVPTEAGTARSGAALDDGPSVDIARVELPEYLNQTHIVIRSQANEVTRSEYDLWAGPLTDEVTRALAENLSLILPTDRIYAGGGRRPIPADFAVEVEIVSFERDGANMVQLVARWRVFRDDGRTLVAMRRSVYRDLAAGSDYLSAVAAMGRVLGDFSHSIATAIREAPRTASHDSPPNVQIVRNRRAVSPQGR